jgi:hypothetical protein
MIVDSVEALRAFGRRCQMRREQEKIDSVIRYYRNRTNPNLVRILDTTPLDGETRDARDLVASCYPRNPCGLYGCPCCGRRFKATAKLDVLKRIAAKCGGLPDPCVISFVTINGPTVPLEPSAVEPARRRFRATLTKVRHAKLPDTSWVGFFDITLGGVVHWHGAILHPGRSKAALARKLREDFPARRAVRVSNWEKEHTLFENLDCIVDYALVADRHVKRRKGKPIVDNETSTLIAKRIVCLQYMAQRGVQGIRLCLNMKSTRVWKTGVMFDKETGETIVVPEIEALILRRRNKAKQNRKWNREGRPALWPRRRATEGIRGVRLSATDNHGSDDAWDELECDEEGFEALSVP